MQHVSSRKFGGLDLFWDRWSWRQKAGEMCFTHIKKSLSPIGLGGLPIFVEECVKKCKESIHFDEGNPI